jgi:hypothetical protein
MSPHRNGFILTVKICLITAMLFLRSPIPLTLSPASMPQPASMVQSTWPVAFRFMNESNICDAKQPDFMVTRNRYSLVCWLITLSAERTVTNDIYIILSAATKCLYMIQGASRAVPVTPITKLTSTHAHAHWLTNATLSAPLESTSAPSSSLTNNPIHQHPPNCTLVPNQNLITSYSLSLHGSGTKHLTSSSTDPLLWSWLC